MPATKETDLEQGLFSTARGMGPAKQRRVSKSPSCLCQHLLAFKLIDVETWRLSFNPVLSSLSLLQGTWSPSTELL